MSGRHRGRRRDGGDIDRRNLVLLWLGQFVNTAGLLMLVPIMPFYVRQLGATGTADVQLWAGVAIAAPAATLTVATPLWGRVGDRVGRKWMVVRALLGLAVAMLVMATAASPLALVAGRLLQGALGGVVEAAAGFTGATGPESKRGASLGKSFSATAGGALVGPLAGGALIGPGGLRPLMVGIAGAACVLAAVCAAGLHEPQQPARRDRRSRAAPRLGGRLLRVPGAVPLAVAAVGGYLGVYGLIPVFAEHVARVVDTPAVAAPWVGTLTALTWGATLVTSPWWGKFNDRTGQPLFTFTIAAGGCGLSIAAQGIPLGVAGLIPLRIAQGVFFAALAQSLFMHASRSASDDDKSAFVGAANSFLLIGQSVGPLLAGPLVGAVSVDLAVTVMGIPCAFAVACAVIPARTEARDAQPGTTVAASKQSGRRRAHRSAGRAFLGSQGST